MIKIQIILPVKIQYYDYTNKKFANKIVDIPMDVEEEWDDVWYKGCITGYKISNLGNVMRPDGSPAKLYYDKDGYTRFCLYLPKNSPLVNNREAIRYPVKTHRAVALSFVDNPDPHRNSLVMHKNDIPDCNIWMNLKWGSPQENMDDKFHSGRSRYLKGEEKVEAKFTENDVRKICDCIYNKGIRNPHDIVRELSIPIDDAVYVKSYITLIHNIKRHHCWNHIIKEYE